MTALQDAIHGNARFVAKAGKEAELERALLDVVVATRQEEGNLRVDMFRSKDQPSIFYLVSAWRNEAALESHFQQSYVRSFLSDAPALQAETSTVGFGVMVSQPA
jgi:quinol monooxygenase YgiN